jgi:putative FmdB family regulatory protein
VNRSRLGGRMGLMEGTGQGDSVMPEYVYKCEACRKSFTATMGMLEHETAKIKCPKCKSVKVRQEITSFGVATKKKS